MVAHEREECGLSVKLVNQTFVKAIDPNIQPYNLPLSNFDRIVGGIPVTIFYAYRSVGDPALVLTTIRTSLSQALNNFFFFSGQITDSPETGETVISCNNAGVRLVEASANVPLAEIDLNKQVLLPIDSKFPLNVQFTVYTCGSFSVSWTFDHSLADAYGFVKFLRTWCDIAKNTQLSAVIDNDRTIFRRTRSPPRYSKHVERAYKVCTPEDFLDAPLPDATEKRLYRVKASSLESLRRLCSDDGSRKTRTEALSAYLWKLLAKTIDGGADARCTMAWAVDGRQRIAGDGEELSNFVGNACALAMQGERVRDLKRGTLSQVARIASRAIREAASGEHFLDLIDWLDCHRLKKVLPAVFLGRGEPGIIVSACQNLPVMSMDFGFGPPLVGMFCSILDRLGVGYVNLVSAGDGDGSWLVSAFVCPALAAAIESDSEHIFDPFRLI